ncbi:MAG: hypothetical protein RIS82_982 [Actinomycetota bacterium]|jgi:cytochrome oxidase assembly protein ShyY1
MTTKKTNALADSWKRWLAWLVAASVFAVGCVFLSDWQFDRRQEAVNKIQLVSANYDQSPAELADLVKDGQFDPANEWRPVLLEGSFMPDKAVLVRNRPYNGQPGFLQVVPFETTNGVIVAIETGWLPTGSKQDSPDVVPLPSSDVLQIIARLRPSEPTLNRNAPAGQLGTLNVEKLVSKVNLQGNVLTSAYLRLATSYDSTKPWPKVLAKPELTEGNHLSYALQWILFALMAFTALIWGIRQEVRFKRMATDETYRPKTRKKIGDADKAAEDALLG